MITVCATCFNINELCVLSTEDIDVFYIILRTGLNPSFVGSEAYTIFGALFKKNKKNYKTKLYVKLNIYIGPVPKNEELLFFK